MLGIYLFWFDSICLDCTFSNSAFVNFSSLFLKIVFKIKNSPNLHKRNWTSILRRHIVNDILPPESFPLYIYKVLCDNVSIVPIVSEKVPSWRGFKFSFFGNYPLKKDKYLLKIIGCSAHTCLHSETSRPWQLPSQLSPRPPLFLTILQDSNSKPMVFEITRWRGSRWCNVRLLLCFLENQFLSYQFQLILYKSCWL